jgi:hypothetical protein
LEVKGYFVEGCCRFDVALTRAKDDLYLTFPVMNPKSYSGDVICRPSRFLEDFPTDMVEEWQVGNSDPCWLRGGVRWRMNGLRGDRLGARRG